MEDDRPYPNRRWRAEDIPEGHIYNGLWDRHAYRESRAYCGSESWREVPAAARHDLAAGRRLSQPNDLQLLKLLKWREVEPGLGQEAAEQAGPVLHPPEPGLDQRGQLIDVLLDQVGQRPFQVRPDRLSRFAIVHAALDRRV